MTDLESVAEIVDYEDGFRAGYDNDGMWTDQSEAWLSGFAEGTELRLWFEDLMEETQ